MIRPLTIVTFLMACGSGLYLYESKHQSQILDRTIERTVRETDGLREQSRLLSTEWTMLNDPEQLRQFADTYLTLKAITPAQFSSLADLDSRLPAVRPPAAAPSQDADGDATDPAAVAPAAGATVPAEPAPAAAATSAPVPPRSAVTPRPPAPVVAVGRPAERKAPSIRLAAADTGPFSKGASGADVRPSEPRVAEQRVREARSRDARLNEPRADQRIARSAETRPLEARVTDVRVPLAPPAPRPVLAAAAPPLVVRAPAPRSVLPYTGSLLGMAHGSGSAPLPRPTPVNAAQWYNVN